MQVHVSCGRLLISEITLTRFALRGTYMAQGTLGRGDVEEAFQSARIEHTPRASALNGGPIPSWHVIPIHRRIKYMSTYFSEIN